MGLVLGVKAHYSQIGIALSLSRSIELHEDLNSINGEGFSNQLEALQAFESSPIRSLSIHCPFRTSSGDFDLFIGGEDAEIADRTLILGDRLSQYCSPVVFVFHAMGENMDHITGERRNESIQALAEEIRNMSGTNRIITIENGANICGTKMFARSEDFEAFFDSSEGHTGMTVDVCHLFMEYLDDGYRALRDLTGSYGDRIFNVHVSDLRLSDPIKSEGTQIGEGDLDFDRIFDSLSAIHPGINVNVIPEINEGHADDYAGFKVALDRLKKYF